MQVTKLNCTACGAPISVPDDLDFINCAACGSFLSIQRGEGFVALKVAEKLARAIEDSGQGTQAVIRESAQVTREELQRLQMSQEISALRMQLTNIQSELRGLLREKGNRVVLNQINSLSWSEFQAIHSIRLLEEKMNPADPQDPQAQIEWLEKEIGRIDIERNQLNTLQVPQKPGLMNELDHQRSEMLAQKTQLRVEGLRKSLTSLTTHPSAEDQAQVAACLKQIAVDEKKLAALANTPEGHHLGQELAAKRKSLIETWSRLEQTRLTGMVTSTNFSAVVENRESIQEYLGLLEQDLAALSGQPDSLVRANLIRTLKDKRQRTRQALQRLDRQTGRSGPGFLAGLLAGLGLGGLAGGAAAAQTPVIPAVEAAPVETDFNPPEAAGTGSRLGWGQLGLGCLSGLAISLAGLLVAGIVIAIIEPHNTRTAPPWTAGVFILLFTAGFGLGVRAFFARIAPGMVVRGLFGLPDWPLSRRQAQPPVSSLGWIRALVGVATAVLILLVFFGLGMWISSDGGGLAVLFLFLAIILGPLAGILAGTHTQVA